MTLRLQIVVLFALIAVVASAQVPTATVTGRVTDPASLVVAGATVSLRSLDSQLARSTNTDRDGSFRLAGVPAGAYRLQVDHPSFRRYEVERLELQVLQRLDLPIQLRLGNRSETIQVSGIAAAVEAAAGPAGFNISQEQIMLLPLAQRNMAGLATLGPGVVARHLGGFTHDVISDVQPARGLVALNPPVNGIRSTANTFLLDGVLNTDSYVNAVITNPPLDSVREFRLQTSASPAEFGHAGGGVLNAVTRSGGSTYHAGVFELFRNDRLDARPYFDSSNEAKAALRQNQFGAHAGGPVPRWRQFSFFGAYEGLRLRQGRASASLVPAEALRRGDFTGASTIRDPRTGQPFPGNRVPAERIDPIARDFLEKFQPLPNRPGEPNNFLETTPDAATHDSVTARVDAQYSPAATFFARYTLNAERGRHGHDFPVRPTVEDIRAQHIAIGHTWAASANRLNEFRLGFSRLRVFELPQNAFRRDVLGELGITGLDRDPVNFGLPTFLLGNFFLATDDPTFPLAQRDQLFQVLDHFSIRQGRHSLTAGGEVRRTNLNYLQRASGRGRFTFTGAYTGDPFADFLLGIPQVTERTVGQPQAYLRRLSFAGFVQDEVRITPRLLLTAGLRYSYGSPFTEKRDNMYNLDWSRLPAPPELVQAAEGGRLGRALVQPDRNDFAPRVGLAWLPRAGMVFRAGYGLFYSPEIAVEIYDLVRNGVRTERNRAPDNAPVLTLRNGFPSSASLGFPSYFGLDPRARTPYVQQWNASWQASVASMVVEAAYVGTKGTKLGRFRAFNTPQHAETGANLPPRSGDIQSLRPFPALGKLIQRQHISNSIYHALQLRAEKRLSKSLQFQASFTWAKSIDDADSIIPGFFDSMGAQDERNLQLERGLSFFDVRKRLTFNGVYDLPFGRGKSWLASGPLAILVSGWRLAGTLLLQDGTPVNPVYFFFAPANSDTPNRPNIVPGVKVTLPRSQRTPERFFNTDAFSAPAPLTFGDAGRNTIPGPGIVAIDAAVHRRFALGESRDLEFRAEMFNAVNHPNFGSPGPYPDFGPFFGRIFSVGEPRRVQLGLRLNF